MSVMTTGKVTPLKCPNCGSALEPEDVNVDLMVALCRSCSSTVELAGGQPLERDPEVRDSPPKELMQLTMPPDGISVAEQGDTLVLTRKWFKPNVQFFGLLLWCIVWDGFLVVWYSIGIASLLAGSGEALIMLLFPILHVAAGVGVTYMLVATVLNHSDIVVTSSHVSIEHGPLPWSAPEPIPVGSIDQFYLVQHTSKNSRTYSLVARRDDLTSEEILKGLPEDVQARYLERRLEAHLGLDDRAVDGEYTG